VGGMALPNGFFPTRTFQTTVLGRDGATGIDDDFAVRGMAGLGAVDSRPQHVWPHPRRVADDQWKGWWGDNPPYHVPVFVLTHHPRARS